MDPRHDVDSSRKTPEEFDVVIEVPLGPKSSTSPLKQSEFPGWTAFSISRFITRELEERTL